MTDIKPKIVEGEPVCGWDSCPVYDHCEYGLSHVIGEAHPCIPALRQQRDEERRTRCWMEVERGPIPSVVTMNDAIRKRMYDFAVEKYGPAVAARLFPEVK